VLSQHAAQVQGVRITRIGIDDLAVQTLSIAELACLMEIKGTAQRSLDGLGAHRCQG
jgi:hypothetical protein